MTAPKLSVYRGLLAKAEVAYGDATAVSNTTDGVLVVNDMVPTHAYVHDGGRKQPPGMAGNMRRTPPSGAGAEFSIEHEAKGFAAAYSASNVPSVHRLILASGFDGAVTTTGGSEKWDYTPTPKGTALTSLSMELYGRETKFPVNGVYLDMKIASETAGDVPLWTFTAKGRAGTRADSAIPAITYPTLTTEPPKTTTLTMVMGSFTTNNVVRSWSCSLNRQIGLRGNQNAASGHAGFSPGRRSVMMEVLIEATDLVGSPYHTSAGLDPYLLWEAGTEIDLSLIVGTVQYNRFKLIAAKGQMAAPVSEEDDEGASLWRLKFQCNPSSVNNNDDLTIRFD